MQPQKLEAFTQHRPLLLALAQQMLDNASDAEDILQEAFLRWQKTEEEIRSPKAYLTTIVTRLCLNHLSLARVRREHAVGASIPERLSAAQMFDPSDYTHLADALATALRVLLESLSPVERAVFLLREVFDWDYEEIAGIVGKSDENCRQIFRRAREHIAGRQVRFDVSAHRQERAVQQFLHASRTGDWQGLMNLVAEDAVLVCDGADASKPAPPPIRGRRFVCDFLEQRAEKLFPAGTVLESTLSNEPTALIAYQNGQPKVVCLLYVRGESLSNMLIITCPVRLRSLLISQGLTCRN